MAKLAVWRTALYSYQPWLAKLAAYLDKRRELRRLKLIHNALPTGLDSPEWAAWRKHCKRRRAVSQAMVTRATKQASQLRSLLGQPERMIHVVKPPHPPQWYAPMPV